MKVITILGSPRKNGNTAKVLGWVEEELRSRGHQAERINIAEYKLEGCIGCYKCQRDPEKLACSHTDHGLEIFQRMIEADAVVYATPLYCWGFTSQIKPLIDRHLCLSTGFDNPSTHKSHIDCKRTALLVTAAGNKGEGNSDLISEVFKRLAYYTKANPVAELIVPLCTTPDAIGEGVREKALAFAGQIPG